MSTVDEILASGRYTDKRGRVWEPDDHWHDYWSTEGGPHAISRTQMRLLIERDQHREFCPGLYDCFDHPVPFIVITGGIPWVCTGEGERIDYMHSLEGSMYAAYELAVGE